MLQLHIISYYLIKLVATGATVAGGIPIWKVALGIHIAGWILQFVGHGVFEGTLAHPMFSCERSFVVNPKFIM